MTTLCSPWEKAVLQAWLDRMDPTGTRFSLEKARLIAARWPAVIEAFRAEADPAGDAGEITALDSTMSASDAELFGR